MNTHPAKPEPIDFFLLIETTTKMSENLELTRSFLVVYVQGVEDTVVQVRYILGRACACFALAPDNTSKESEQKFMQISALIHTSLGPVFSFVSGTGREIY